MVWSLVLDRTSYKMHITEIKSLQIQSNFDENSEMHHHI